MVIFGDKNVNAADQKATTNKIKTINNQSASGSSPDLKANSCCRNPL